MGFAEVAPGGDLVGKAGVTKVDAHRLTITHLQPQTLAAADIRQGEIAAQEACLPQIAAL